MLVNTTDGLGPVGVVIEEITSGYGITLFILQSIGTTWDWRIYSNTKCILSTGRSIISYTWCGCLIIHSYSKGAGWASTTISGSSNRYRCYYWRTGGVGGSISWYVAVARGTETNISSRTPGKCSTAGWAAESNQCPRFPGTMRPISNFVGSWTLIHSYSKGAGWASTTISGSINRYRCTIGALVVLVAV